MKVLFKNAEIYEEGTMKKADMLFDGVSVSLFSGDTADVTSVIDNIAILPGFCDVHVHLREPGFSYKETIKSGTAACAHGGYTAVCSMPNLNPAPDSIKNLKVQLDIIERDAGIAVHPYGTITKCEAGIELSDMADMANSVCAFSDDGRGVQSDAMMLASMKKSRALGKMIVAHCEDNSLLFGGYIHDGEYARAHGHRGICSESEWGQIKRDVELARETGCPYHVCHISTKESVEIIRKAKSEGVNITCETAPHYILLDESALTEDARFKMNPPLRGKDDREAILRGVLDGTIDMIATDHAPHSKEEKSMGLEKSPMGVVGIETAFPVLYTGLVKAGLVTLSDLIKLISENPRGRFGIKSDVGFTIWKLDEKYKIDPSEFLSMGKSTPFEGCEVYGKCLATVCGGKAAYLDKSLM